MNEDWKKDITPTPTNYALTADPGKPLRESQETIRQLNEQVSQLTKIHEEDEAQIKHLHSMMDNMRQCSRIEERRLKDQIDTVITERNVYRDLVHRLMKIKD